MENNLNTSLKKIFKGTAITFLGIFLGKILTFITRIIIARSISPSEYGIFSLALTIQNILATIGIIGLGEGVNRFIAYYYEKEPEKASTIISSSIKIALFWSTAIGTLAFVFASQIANFFSKPALIWPIQIFAISVPFTVLSTLIVAIFRGFGEIEIRAWFKEILLSAIKLALTALAVLSGLAFKGIIYAQVISFVSIAIVLIIVLWRKKREFIIRRKLPSASPLMKELLRFSLPIFGMGAVGIIITWTDTFMLGYFKAAKDVGLYNVALPLSQIIGTMLHSLNFAYTPIATSLYAQNALQEIKRLYVVLTKWVFSLAFPLTFILLFFPRETLAFFFGSRYENASLALQLLTIGFLTNVIAGPNNSTLLVYGRSELLFANSTLAANTNVVLNYLLIPPLNITGAAIASVLSMLLRNFLSSIEVYLISKVHPLGKDFLKTLSVAIFFSLAFFFPFKKLLSLSINFIIPIFIISALTFAFLMFFFKSVTEEDIMLLKAVEQKLGIDATLIKSFLKRFIV